jgi:CRISPR-associated protein Cas5d
MSGNTVIVRVWGDFACFTRPEMKVERVSYPIMTPSAARGVLEAIYWEPQMYYGVQEIAVVRRGRWINLRRNEVQAIIKIDSARSWMTGGRAVEPIHAGGGAPDGTQRNTLALSGVEYLVSAEVRLTDRAQPPGDNLAKYVDQFRKRATTGKCFHRPCLGCREFAADFEWQEDPGTVQVEPWDEDLGLMLYDVFDPTGRKTGQDLKPQAVFFEARVVSGRMNCRPDQVRLVRPDNEDAKPCS